MVGQLGWSAWQLRQPCLTIWMGFGGRAKKNQIASPPLIREEKMQHHFSSAEKTEKCKIACPRDEQQLPFSKPNFGTMLEFSLFAQVIV
ncbi:hypothetical protein C4D60_Mb10t17360 [Musa balbisiana]|uniref:Uncharacterized protein n=1 Tax=Musa balbisiana TaxID=52838 RepID=A0A4S8IXU9_MUSBA|nr:hypothetical protein C4D60_Mb10t17360 [Musa balbisiana]